MQPHRIKTISEYHHFMGLPKPEHPMISVSNFQPGDRFPYREPVTLVIDFYLIGLKKNFAAKIRYGQQAYDFDEGTMIFIAPGQVFRIDPEKDDKEDHHAGWILLVQPDFLWNTALAKGIKQYEYFDYSVHEALFLSEKEEMTITGILRSIHQEYTAGIDKFSQSIMITQLEQLLAYSERFYHRQFITRKITNHKILGRLDSFLTDYFNNADLTRAGLPSVQQLADELHVSPNYLSSLLKILTGQSTQHHIHDKLIEKAKEKLSTTDASISEIAYDLGFEHPQSFSRLFKVKTNSSPVEFRQSFN